MENLAFLHASTAYEDPSEAPTLCSLEELGLTPNSTMLGIAASAAAGLTVLGTPSDAQAVVQMGDSGDAVYDVQIVLNDLGYDTCGIDGIFGDCTNLSVYQFQFDNGLTFQDGIVGPETAAAMGLSGPEFGIGGGGTPDGGPNFVTISTNGSPLTVRTGPGTFYAPIDYLANGTSVRVVGFSSGWYEISGGGWISADWTVEGGGGGGGIGGDAGSIVVSTNGSELLIRSGPGMGFAVVGGYANGAVVDYFEYSNGWYGTSLGWVSEAWVFEL